MQNDEDSVNEATKTGTSNTCTLTLFSAKYVFKIIVLKLEKQQLYTVNDTKFFDFRFLIPSTYNTAKYVLFIFVAIAIADFCVQLVKQLFLYIYNEVSGAFSGIAYFLIILYVPWFCFSEKIACGHPFYYFLVKMFWYVRTNRQGLPGKKI